MAGFGVTNEGFNLKGFDLILADSLDRARQMFGATIDLTTTSPLRKILEVTSAEDAELWKRMEDLYYSNFVSTALGDNLDLLGEFRRFRVRVPCHGRRFVQPDGNDG